MGSDEGVESEFARCFLFAHERAIEDILITCV